MISREQMKRMLKMIQFQEQAEENKVKYKENKKNLKEASYHKDLQNLLPDHQDWQYEQLVYIWANFALYT